MRMYVTHKREDAGRYDDVVALCVGAWVEIVILLFHFTAAVVVPCVGAWVEILP